MCGIAGYLGSRIIDDGRAAAAHECLKHRGPDGSGYYRYSGKNGLNCLFLHSRLAIIDSSKDSSQPMRIANKILIFNGEIYNYIEVREELKNLGHKFLSTGDAEVLGLALLEWGEAALHKLEGMWSFAWFDIENEELLLSRDRFGEKPLLYFQERDGIYFASETKALAALVGRRFDVNEEQILRFLVNGYKSLYKTDQCFYKGIRRLEHASNMRIDQELNIKLAKYWNNNIEVNQDLSFSDAVDKTSEALRRAIEIRMRADVPIAFCMSGGIDSNALVGFASRNLAIDVHGFSIINDDPRYDESNEILASLKHLGIRHTSVKANKQDFLSNMVKLVDSHDSPIHTLSYYLHAQLLETVAQAGYKVSISGTGADEIFSGYYDHYIYYLKDISGNLALFNKTLKSWEEFIVPGIRNELLKNKDVIYSCKSPRSHLYDNSNIYTEYTHIKWVEEFREEAYSGGELRNRMQNEMFHESVPVMLHEDDLNAMRVSIENRSPYLDRMLFETIYSLPVEYLMRGCWSKALLRYAARTVLAPVVLNKRLKIGFNAALEELVDINDPDVVEYFLEDGPIFQLIRRESVEKLLFSDQPWSNSSSKFLFSFLGCKMFMEFND